MTSTKEYSKEYSDQFRKGFTFEQILIKSRRQRVLASLERYPHKSILEIGCGLNPVFPYIENFDLYTAVDPSPGARRNVRKLAYKQSNITIIPYSLEEGYKLLEKNLKFDFVIMSSLLHEVSNPDKLLQAVNKICCDDTIIHINVPNVRSFHRYLAYEMGMIEDIFEISELGKRFQRHTNFDKKSLFEIVKKNDFQIISFGTYFIKPFSNEQMDKIIKQRIVDKSFIIGLENMIKYMPEMGCEMYVDAKIK